jgi:hypothetical protein
MGVRLISGATLGSPSFSSVSLGYAVEASVGATSITGYKVYTFTSDGSASFKVVPKSNTNWTKNNSVEYLVVAGGGGGNQGSNAGRGGAGGGAGGMKIGTVKINPLNLNVTIDAGAPPDVNDGENGTTKSSLGNLVSTTRGGGGAQSVANIGGNGGSGGGNGGYSSTAGTGISGEGNNGFFSTGTTTRAGSGGGGKSAVGGTSTGGAGLASSITGSSVTYAVGGDGGAPTGGANGTNGTANRGNGGKGGGASDIPPPLGSGGSGGSGIVVFRVEV